MKSSLRPRTEPNIAIVMTTLRALLPCLLALPGLAVTAPPGAQPNILFIITDGLVNTGIDLLPTMLEFAGLPVPGHLPGRSLLPLAFGRPVATWRDCVVVQNNLNQAGEIDGLKPQMEGRMVRTERYKYCVYNRGMRRESLVDMRADPGETINLASDPKYRDVLLQHRALLGRFGREHADPLVAELLRDDVRPIPFDR